MEFCSPTSGRLPAHIDLRHGPRALLGRFFLAADAAARQRGVTLHFAGLGDLLAANERHRDTWRPIMPLFDPAFSEVDARTAFVLLGYDDAGEVVAAQAARFYDWPDTILQDEASSLRMFYRDPQAALAEGNHCTLATPSAARISGRVVFSGAGWYRPDFRGKGLAGLLPRISRALAHALWDTRHTFSMMADAVISRGFAERTGYTRIEHGVVDFTLAPIGAFRGAFVWMETPELVADLERTLATLTAAATEPALLRTGSD